MTAAIRINGVTTTSAVVPFGVAVALLNADLTGVTTQTWEIIYPDDISGTNPDFATNFPGWVLGGDGILRITQTGAYPAVNFTNDISGDYGIRLTVTAGSVIVLTAAVRVPDQFSGEFVPFPGMTTEANTLRGWAEDRNRSIKTVGRRQAKGVFARVVNNSGSSIARGRVAKVTGFIDTHSVTPNAVPAGSSVKAEKVPTIALAHANDAGISDSKLVIADETIANNGTGWVQILGPFEGGADVDYSGFTNNAPVYLSDTGTQSATPGTNVIVVGSVIENAPDGSAFIASSGGSVSLATTPPANVSKSAAVTGTDPKAAHADHKHDVDTGVPVATGTANAEGAATQLARRDHVHQTSFAGVQAALGAATGAVPFNGQQITGLASGGTTLTNGANIGDILARAIEVDGISTGAVQLSALAFPASGLIVVKVLSVKDYFVLDRTSTLTADGIGVVTALGGTGRWIRLEIAHPFWLTQTSWGINPSTGNDENLGTTGSPLKTRTELARRLDGGRLTAPMTVTITASLNAGDVREPQVDSDLTNFISWVGVPRLLFSGTITALTNRNGATSQPTLMTIASIASSWTLGNGVDSFLNMLVEWDDGGSNFITSRVCRDMGSKQAWLSPPINQGNLEATFTNGNTVKIYDVPSLGPSVFHNTAKQTFTYLKVDQRWLSGEGQLTLTKCWGDAFLMGGSVSIINGVSGGLFSGANLQNLGSRLTITGGYHRLIQVGGTCTVSQTAAFLSLQVENSQALVLSGGAFGTPDIEICTTSTSLTPILLPNFGKAHVTCHGFVYGSTARTGALFAELQGRGGEINLGHVPNVTGANTISYTLAGTTDNVSVLATRESNDVNANRVIGPAGPTWNDNRSQVMANLGSGGSVLTNAANIGDILSRAIEVDGISTGAVQLSTLAFPASGSVVVKVLSVKDFFYLDRTSTLTANGISIVTALGGTGRWIRMRIAHPFWRTQLNWFIDPANATGTASDENTGADLTHQLRTRSEFYRRMGNLPLSNTTGIFTVTIADDLQATDSEKMPFASDTNSLPGLGSYVKFVGVPKVLHTGVLGTVVNRNGSTSVHTKLEIPSIPSTFATGAGGVSFIGKMVRWTDGVNFIEARIVDDDGTKTAWVSAPFGRNNLETTFTSGTTVIIYDVPSLGVDEFILSNHVEYEDLKVNSAASNGHWFNYSSSAFLTRCEGDVVSFTGNLFSSNGHTGIFAGASHICVAGVTSINGGYHRLIIVSGSACRINVCPTLKTLAIEQGATVSGLVQGVSPVTPQITVDLEFHVTSVVLDAILCQISGGNLEIGGYVYGTAAGPSLIAFKAMGYELFFAHTPTVTGTNATLVTDQLEGTTYNITDINTKEISDKFGNRIVGPAGPTVNDNRSQPIANLGSGGSVLTNAANIGDILARAPEVDGISTGAIQLASYAFPTSGSVIVKVLSVKDYFELDRTSTMTADGISVVTALGGTGRWIRMRIPHPFWITQTTWFINPSTGNDENTGVDSSHQLKTLSEFARRTYKQWLPASMTVTIAGSLNAGDNVKPLIYGHFTTPAAVVNYVGVPTSVFTGTLSSCVARNGATSQPTTVQSSWTVASLIGKLVEWTDGVGGFKRAVIVSDRGGGVAWLSPPLDQNSAETTFSNGQTINVYDYPSLGEHIVRGGANTFTYLNATHWISIEGRTDFLQCSGTVHGWGGGVGLVNHFNPVGADDGNHNHTFFAGTTCNVGGGFNGFVLGRGTFLRVSVATTLQRIQLEQSWLTVAALGATYNDVEFCSVAGPTGVIWAIGVPGGGASFQGFVYGEASTVKPAVLCEGRDVTIGFSHVPVITNATTVSFSQAGTSFPVTDLATKQLDDTFNNRVIGPAGPTLNDNRSQQIQHLGSAGGVSTNAANYGDVLAAVAGGVGGSVSLTGHAVESVLASISGTVVDIGLATNQILGRGTGDVVGISIGTDQVLGRIGSGAIGGISATAAGRAMLGAADAAAQTALLNTFTSTLKGLAPLSGGGTTNFLRADGTWAAPAGTGGTITALTGDVTASGSGSVVATISAGAVTNAKMANMATSTFKGRITAGSGPPEDLTSTQATSLLNTFTSTLKGLVPLSGGGTANFLRADGSWAAPAGTGSLTDGNKGDITVSGSGAIWTINTGAVSFGKILDNGVTMGKLEPIGPAKLIGFDGPGAGTPFDISVIAPLKMVSGSGQLTFDTGFTQGSLIFQGASQIAQDNAKIFWNDISFRLGVGTNTPVFDIDAFNSNGNFTTIASRNNGTATTTGSQFLASNSSGFTGTLGVTGTNYAAVPATPDLISNTVFFNSNANMYIGAAGSIEIATGVTQARRVTILQTGEVRIAGLASGGLVQATSGTGQLGATPYFGGDIPFGSASGLLTQNPNFVWDNTLFRLGVGISSPTIDIDVRKSLNNPVGVTAVNSNGGTQAQTQFIASNGTSSMSLGITGTGNTITGADIAFLSTASSLLLIESDLGDISFLVGGSPTERMRITTTGFIVGGVGPAVSLNFKGTTNAISGGINLLSAVGIGRTVAGTSFGPPQFALAGNMSMPSSTSAVLDYMILNSPTITLTGGTNITTATGFNLVSFEHPVYSTTVTIGDGVHPAGATVAIKGAPTITGGGAFASGSAPVALWVQGPLAVDGDFQFNGSTLVASGSNGILVNATGGNGITVQSSGSFITMNAAGTVGLLFSGSGRTFDLDIASSTCDLLYKGNGVEAFRITGQTLGVAPLQFGAASVSAIGAGAGSIGSTLPVGASTTPRKYLKVRDDTGAIGFVPWF